MSLVDVFPEGRFILIRGVLFRIRKVTKKDLILRPVNKKPEPKKSENDNPGST